MTTGSNNAPSLMDGIDAGGARSQGSASGSNPARSQQLKIGLSIAAILVALVLLAWQTFGGGQTAAEESVRRAVVDAETGEIIEEFRIPKDGMYPWVNPASGKATLYPAEKCFWTKDGKAKLKPTYVLLNQFKGEKGDTICPDCGRRVVAHNPMPPMNLFNDALGVSDPAAGK